MSQKPMKRNRKPETVEALIIMKAVDITSREIRSSESIEFYCHSCNNTGFRKLTDAKKSININGFYYQCKDCYNKKIANRSEAWKDNVKKSCQTEEKKEFARKLAADKIKHKNIKNICDYWDFKGINILEIKGTDYITAICKVCNHEEHKQLKKIIEAVDTTKTRGCGSCWNHYIKSYEYAEEKSKQSKEYWDSDGAIQSKTNLRDRSDNLQASFAAAVEDGRVSGPKSKPEDEIREFIHSLGLETEKWNRIFNHKNKKLRRECDIVIPTLNIGIEHNGVFSHKTDPLYNECDGDVLSNNYKYPSYHLEKTKLYKRDFNLDIIHIFEHEWAKRKWQIKSFLRSKFNLNQTNKGARQLTFRWVSPLEVNDFVDKYHIQSYSTKAISAIGAYYQDELFLVATFSKHHRNNEEIVLSRFVCKEGVTIAGGLSKITKMGLEKYNELVSWCDLRFSTGEGYKKAGWIDDGDLPPDYMYWNPKTRKPVNKQARQKDKVNTPEHMTENEHAKLDGLFKLYDCGKRRFRIKKGQE